MKRLLLSLFLLAAMSISALAADIGGKWKGTAEGPNGPIERTFTFQVEGGKLTGETDSQMMGKSVLEGGKVEGDNVSFTITANFQGNEMKLTYAGKVEGDTIKLKVDFAGTGQTVEYILKRM